MSPFTRTCSLDDKCHILENCFGIPFTTGNRIRILRNGVQIFPAMLDAINQATSSVDFMTYVYWQGDIADKFATALAQRAQKGVRIRVLLDAVGSRPMSSKLIEKMQNAGVAVRWFRPLARLKIWRNNNRSHRKILVCDGSVGFTGGVGIAEEWEGDARNPNEWRETHFEVRGPAVQGLYSAFITNWAETNDRIDPYAEPPGDTREVGSSKAMVMRSSSTAGWSDAKFLLRAMIALARERIRVTTAYFVPDPVMRDMLIDAARNGVRVELLVPGRHTDHRMIRWAVVDDLIALIQGGVQIAQYQKTMVHAKIVTIDSDLALTGSVNCNQRSMSRDDEVALVIADEDCVRQLNADYEADMKNARILTVEDVRPKTILHAARNKFFRMLKSEF